VTGTLDGYSPLLGFDGSAPHRDGHGAGAGRRVDTSVDHDLVARLRGTVLRELSAERLRRVNAGHDELTRGDEKRMGRSVLVRGLAARRNEQVAAGIALPSSDEDEAVLAAVTASLFGLGRLQALIDDQRLTEININGCDQVWLVHDDGTKEAGPPVADSDTELVEWVRKQATYNGLSSKAWDPTNWKIEMALPDGSRVVGLLGASARPTISIRLRRRHHITLDQLRAMGDYDHRMQRLLEAMVEAKMNIIISGPTHSGKTTLSKALIAHIGPHERIVTIEHFRELGVDEDPVAHPDAVALEGRLPNSEGHGAITLKDLVEASRRIDPDRIIVGECTGPEILVLMEAMTQGNDGGITTIHARSARDVPQRIATYAADQGVPMEAALLKVSSAVDFIIHIARGRYITSVVEVGAYDPGVGIITSEVMAAAPGERVATPQACISAQRAAVLAAHGWDPARDHREDPQHGGAVL